jgi:hypothetical protein
MRNTIVAAILFTLTSFSTLDAQSKGTSKKVDPFPGYTVMEIQGFPNITISRRTMEEDERSKQDRKPLEVLELELAKMAEILPPKTLQSIKNIRIWVEWDEEKAMSNGRAGTSLAVFFGGHQLAAIRDGMHPQKANAITILSMKALTEEHQPKKDSGRCVILHEMAHAIHFLYYGGDSNVEIRQAYKQAMERKLYDPKLYAATNEAEYFAETMCAYFDQLDYYPRNRAELLKHDPYTHKMHTGFWGKPKMSTTAPTKKDATTTKSTVNPEWAKYKLDKFEFGKPMKGEEVDLKKFDGKPVIILMWNAVSSNSLAGLSKVQAWVDELDDFGLQSVAVHMTGNRRVAFDTLVQKRNIRMLVTDTLWIEGGPVENFRDFPQAMVFSAEGECLFKGSAFDAETTIRQVVGDAIVKRLEKSEFSDQVQPVIESLRKGTFPPTLVPKLSQLVGSSRMEVATEAKAIVSSITFEATKRLEEAEAIAKTEPVEALMKVENIPTVYKGTLLASKVEGFLGKLKTNSKSVNQELLARKILNQIRKLDTTLSGKPSSFDPTLAEFRNSNAATLSEIKKAIEQIRKAFPKTKATEEADRMGEYWGV